MSPHIKTPLMLCTGILLCAVIFMAFESRGRFIESRFGILSLFLLIVGAAALWVSNKKPDSK
jgi:uncharacterized membrane protein SirB2